MGSSQLIFQIALYSAPGCCLEKFCGPYHLEEGSVVTRFPSMTLRKDIFANALWLDSVLSVFALVRYHFEEGGVVTRLCLYQSYSDVLPTPPLSALSSLSCHVCVCLVSLVLSDLVGGRSAAEAYQKGLCSGPSIHPSIQQKSLAI